MDKGLRNPPLPLIPGYAFDTEVNIIYQYLTTLLLPTEPNLGRKVDIYYRYNLGTFLKSFSFLPSAKTLEEFV